MAVRRHAGKGWDADMEEYILEMRGIVKRFPGVVALNGVNFQLKHGEIHALMGENGAGKSTFIKVITGVHQPDGGEILLEGKPVVFKDPMEASEKSIAAIYQHTTAFPHLSITENIFAGHEKMNRFGVVQWKEMHEKARGLLESLGCRLDPHILMSNLSVAEQQIVEIAKAVSTQARIIIMDEPTAALSERECEELYRITEKLRDDGTSIIFISHRIEDMYRLATRVTVLRDAQYIGTWDVEGLQKEVLIQAMVGRTVNQLYPKKKVPIGEVVLEAQNVTQVGYFRDISFSVRKGEILGLTGLVGAGRSELCQAICGVTRMDGGTTLLNGTPFRFTHPCQAIRAGIGYLPEDRQIQGLILDWEIYKNETLSTLEKYSGPLGLKGKMEKDAARFLSQKVSVKATSVFDKASSLSGGNQQKVVFAKLLDSDLKLLILDEPTKGVDVGAKAQIYEIISELAEQGYAIILISSEMPEVMAMSDRIAVMAGGRLVKIFEREGATQEEILKAALHSEPQAS